MSITKNPFERQPGRKPAAESKEAATSGKMGQAASNAGSNLPPTRGSGSKTAKKPGRAVAGYEVKNKPAPKAATVSHTGPPTIATPAWAPPANKAKDGAVPATPLLGTQPGEHAFTVAGSDGKEVMVSTSTVPDDYSKLYAQRVEESTKAIVEKADEKMTGENYKEVYLAQEQRKADLELQVKQNENIVAERNKKNEEILALKNKAQQLQANIAALKQRLGKEGPDVDHSLYASIDEMTYQLNEINPVYWT